MLVATLMPATARASVFGSIIAALTGNGSSRSGYAQRASGNLQALHLPTPAMNLNPSPATGGGGVVIVDGSALLPSEGPSGTIADIAKPKNGTISTYVVQTGDTVSEIAELFGVPVSTILWANDISRATQLRVGQKLTILPIPGIIYTVKKGDTLSSIAKRYDGSEEEILSYNGLSETSLAVGTDIIIPNGEMPATVAKSSSGKKTSVSSGSAHDVGPRGDASEVAYYISPLSRYTKTQGIHGYNSVDLAAPSGTPIVASATGDVVVAKDGGWNGGYGSYVVVGHGNGSQTLYSHMSKVNVYGGQHVVQGQVIGYVGATGLATGSHLHFEIRNGIRNPF
ncbi:MAG: M23 family metallopeptidase [Patescibacteria group bacterium]|nr:M23 family metallopeptidase [Patescibacteria group bacterium]